MSPRTYLATAMAAVLFATAPVMAQDQEQEGSPTMSVNPSVLKEGEGATINYSDPSLAGQTVTIEIDNGMRKSTQTAVVVIELDSSGCGTGVWTVPGWFGANFNAPGVPEVHCPIVQS